MRRELLIFGLCLVAVGCNADPRCRRETALLRAEILDLEDKYYLLKSERDLAVSELSAFQNGCSEGGFIYESSAEPITYRAMESTDPSTSYAPGIVTPPANQLPGEGEVPELESSDPFPMELNLLPGSANPATGPEFEPVYQGDQSGAMLNGPASNTASLSVADIVIDTSNSRGHDVDGKPGDEGLNLLIQPKTFSGETLLQAGELTVSVIDPAESADQQRIGLWKFLPQETELFFANDNPGARYFVALAVGSIHSAASGSRRLRPVQDVRWPAFGNFFKDSHYPPGSDLLAGRSTGRGLDETGWPLVGCARCSREPKTNQGNSSQ